MKSWLEDAPENVLSAKRSSRLLFPTPEEEEEEAEEGQRETRTHRHTTIVSNIQT